MAFIHFVHWWGFCIRSADCGQVLIPWPPVFLIFTSLLVIHFLLFLTSSPLEVFLSPASKGLISLMHSQIFCLSTDTFSLVKLCWKEDLGEVISEDVWVEILKRVNNSSICVRHGLIQCKILHGVYYTKAQLAKIFCNVSSARIRCHQSPANLLHMFWLCPSWQNLWVEVFDTLLVVAGEKWSWMLWGLYLGFFHLSPCLLLGKMYLPFLPYLLGDQSWLSGNQQLLPQAYGGLGIFCSSSNWKKFEWH